MVPRLSPSRETPHVGDGAGHCGCRSGEWTGEKCPTALPLTPLEVPITGAHRAFSRGELVAVHGDAHRAARFAPFGARFLEDAIQPFRFRLALHVARSRHDEH